MNLPHNPAERGRHPLLRDIIFSEQQFKNFKNTPLSDINAGYTLTRFSKYLHCRTSVALCLFPHLSFEGSCFPFRTCNKSQVVGETEKVENQTLIFQTCFCERIMHRFVCWLPGSSLRCWHCKLRGWNKDSGNSLSKCVDIFACTEAAVKKRIYVLETRCFHPIAIVICHFAPAGLSESCQYPALRLHSDRYQQG